MVTEIKPHHRASSIVIYKLEKTVLFALFLLKILIFPTQDSRHPLPPHKTEAFSLSLSLPVCAFLPFFAMQIFHWRMPAAMHLRAFLFPFLSLSFSIYIYISPRNPFVSAPGPLFLAACQSISNVVVSYFVLLNHLLLPRLFLSFELLKSLLVTLLLSSLPSEIS